MSRKDIKTGKLTRYTIPRNQNNIWPSKGDIDSNLVGFRAYEHPAVHEWLAWLRTSYLPRYDMILITPCSNVKPYPRSPQSSKIRGVLRRLGFWNDLGLGYKGAPMGIEWLYLSDLLALVPYDKAHLYPACCYDAPPDLVMSHKELLVDVVNTIEIVFKRVADQGVMIIAYLPSRYVGLMKSALDSNWGERVVYVKYHIFYGHKYIEETIVRLGRGSYQWR